MKKLFQTGAAFLAALMLLAGCGSNAEESKEEEPSEILYPVSINGTEILLGETTVQALLDAGFRITVSEMSPDNKITEYEIDPNTQLDAYAYYSGASIWITDSTFAHISMVTDENRVLLGEAVIASLEFYLGSDDEESMKNISFNNVPLAELDRDRAGEMFPDFTASETFVLKYGLDYDYSLSFNPETGKINKFSLSKDYDVDWNSNK